MKGVKLKAKLRADLTISEVTQGGIGYSTDTNELVANEYGILKFRPVKIIGETRVGKGNLLPFASSPGDLFLSTEIGENRDSFGMDAGVWKTRFEGYSEEYITNHFEPRVDEPTPDDYVKRDGSTPLDANYDLSSGDSVVSKAFIDALVSDTSDYIKTDGTKPMDNGYEPQSENDVVTYEFLSTGKYVMVPPTSAIVLDAIWNDNGTPRISDTIMNWLVYTPTQPIHDIKIYDERLFGFINDIAAMTMGLYEIDTGDGSQTLLHTFNFIVNDWAWDIYDNKFYFCAYTHDLPSRGIYSFNMNTFAQVNFTQISYDNAWNLQANEGVVITSFGFEGVSGLVTLHDASTLSLKKEISSPNPIAGNRFCMNGVFSKNIYDGKIYISEDTPPYNIHIYDLDGVYLETHVVVFPANATSNKTYAFGGMTQSDNYISVSQWAMDFEDESNPGHSEKNNGGCVMLYDRSFNFIRIYRLTGNYLAETWGWFGTHVMIDEPNDLIFISATGDYNDIDLDPNYNKQGVGAFFKFKLSTGELVRKNFVPDTREEWQQGGYHAAIDTVNRSFYSTSPGAGVVERYMWKEVY